MTQKHLETLTYEIVASDVFDESKETEETDLLDKFIDEKKLKSPKEENHSDVSKSEVPERNLIRKVEMVLDHETDIHIYEDKYKIIVKKQTPFYMSKKTWKLMIKKQKTINTASTLTEI